MSRVVSSILNELEEQFQFSIKCEEDLRIAEDRFRMATEISRASKEHLRKLACELVERMPDAFDQPCDTTERGI